EGSWDDAVGGVGGHRGRDVHGVLRPLEPDDLRARPGRGGPHGLPGRRVGGDPARPDAAPRGHGRPLRRLPPRGRPEGDRVRRRPRPIRSRRVRAPPSRSHRHAEPREVHRRGRRGARAPGPPSRAERV
ncbi:MAG: hypothetical protein AVDCRST_MAG12-2343, partial [uncultured Rubrobacteraceae bacterium]